jgi:hypothetical protein
MNTLGTEKFGQKWVDRTTSKCPEEPTCSRDQFVLSVLSELGVVDCSHHVAPLSKVIISLLVVCVQLLLFWCNAAFQCDG